MSRAIIATIRMYQRFLSPDHSIWARVLGRSPYCRYTPSCSEYAVHAIETWGVWRGVLYAFGRVLRCHPWSRGGYDPVPPVHSKH